MDKELIGLRQRLQKERAARRETEERIHRDREVTGEAIALVRVMSQKKQQTAESKVAKLNRQAEVVRRAAAVYVNDDGEFDTRRITETLARCVAAYCHTGGAMTAPARTAYRPVAPE